MYLTTSMAKEVMFSVALVGFNLFVCLVGWLVGWLVGCQSVCLSVSNITQEVTKGL